MTTLKLPTLLASSLNLALRPTRLCDQVQATIADSASDVIEVVVMDVTISLASSDNLVTGFISRSMAQYQMLLQRSIEVKVRESLPYGRQPILFRCAWVCDVMDRGESSIRLIVLLDRQAYCHLGDGLESASTILQRIIRARWAQLHGKEVGVIQGGSLVLLLLSLVAIPS